MQHVITIDVPDDYPETVLRNRIREIEELLKKEAKAFRNGTHRIDDSDIDPWDALDLEAIAVDTGQTDGSVNHDHYIYGTPKR